MNNKWISDSHESADYFRGGREERDIRLGLIRILDVAGMFETSWLVFDHPHNKYGYPNDE